VLVTVTVQQLERALADARSSYAEVVQFRDDEKGSKITPDLAVRVYGPTGWHEWETVQTNGHRP
jgi:hypothetical protein